MKSLIVFLTTILILLSNTMITGQNDNSFQKNLTFSQIDLISVEMVSLLKIIIEKPSLLNDFKENSFLLDKTASVGISKQSDNGLLINKDLLKSSPKSFNTITFNDITSPESNLYFESSQLLDQDYIQKNMKRLVNKNPIAKNEQSIMHIQNINSWYEIKDIPRNTDVTIPVPALNKSLGGWKF